MGNSETSVVKTVAQVGNRVRGQRTVLGLRQIDLAGLGNTGNRFIVDLENGKPTVQLQKVMDTLDLLGLELVVRPKTGGLW
jgi:HTH-type transcriptional regulator / antitoxin HipB